MRECSRAFPSSLCALESRATKFRVLAIAEAGDTVTADHLLQMASLAAEHKPTVLGIPGQVPIPCQLECTVVLLQSLHALFQLLTSGNTTQHCPQAASFAVALGTAARQDNGHIVSMASSLALALLLTAFDLEPDHQRHFIRPVRKEEAETNTECTDYDLRASDAASYIPGCHVVIVTTGLSGTKKDRLTPHSTPIWKMWTCSLAKRHSRIWTSNLPLRRQFPPFFRLLLGDPKQSPGGVADGLLKAPIGLRAPTTWYMPHETPGVFHMRSEKVKATSSFACQLQSTYKDLSRVDLDLPEGLLVGLECAATSPDSPLDFQQAQNAAERSEVASPHC